MKINYWYTSYFYIALKMCYIPLPIDGQGTRFTSCLAPPGTRSQGGRGGHARPKYSVPPPPITFGRKYHAIADPSTSLHGPPWISRLATGPLLPLPFKFLIKGQIMWMLGRLTTKELWKGNHRLYVVVNLDRLPLKFYVDLRTKHPSRFPRYAKCQAPHPPHRL